MTKEFYLKLLRKKLTRVDPDWKEEVLADIEEHFSRAAELHMTDDEIIRHLGSPDVLAEAFYEEAARIGKTISRPQADEVKTTIQALYDKYDAMEGKTQAAPEMPAEPGRDADSQTVSHYVNDVYESLSARLKKLSESVSTPVKDYDVQYNDSRAEECTMYEPHSVITRVVSRTGTPDVRVVPALDGRCRVTYPRALTGMLMVYDREGVLQISQNGNYSLRGGAGGYVEIALPEQSVDLDLEARAGDIRVSGPSTLGTVHINCGGGDVRLQTTRVDGLLDITTAAGDQIISIREAERDIRLNSASGDIQAEISYLKGRLQARASSGDLTIKSERVGGAVDAQASSGEVVLRLEKTFASVRATSVAGDVNVWMHEGCGGDAELSSVHGDLLLWAASVAGNVSLSSTNGDIEADLAKDPPFSMNLRARGGDLRVNRQSVPSHVLQTQNGTHRLSASTVNGDIDIRLA